MSTLPIESTAQSRHQVRDVPRFFFPPFRQNVLREVLIVGVAAFMYFVVRGLIHSQESRAMDHATTLIDLERRLGIFHESTVQSWILPHEWLVNLVNSVYIYGHWPVIAGTLIWMLVSHRQYVPLIRSAILISGAIGIVFFVLFPMAPPRFMVDYGFIDTVTLHSEPYRVLQPPSLTNQFAAMPSLHVGWNLLMGIAIVNLSSRWYFRAFGVLMPLSMYIATILSANHYYLDGIVGSALALIGLAVAGRISAPKPEPRPVPARVILTSGYLRR